MEADQVLTAVGPDGEARPQLEFAPRGFFNIGRRNVGGRNHARSVPCQRSAERCLDRPGRPGESQRRRVHQYRVVGTFRRPRAFWSSDVVMTPPPSKATAAASSRAKAQADVLRRLSPTIRLHALLVQHDEDIRRRLDPEDQATIDRISRVRLSAASGAIARDARQRARTEPQRRTTPKRRSRRLWGRSGYIGATEGMVPPAGTSSHRFRRVARLVSRTLPRSAADRCQRQPVWAPV